jgi:hypothetical protein
MMRARCVLLLVVFLCCASITVTAQPHAIELFGGGFLWLPMSSFRDVSGIPSPESIRFTSASPNTSQRGVVSVGADLMNVSSAQLGISVGYLPVSMRYSGQERAPIALENGALYIATLQHDISAKVELLTITARLRYPLSEWLNVEASLPIGILMNGRYTQTMRFVDPAGLTFVDGQLEQVTGSGNIANKRSIIPSIALHASAELPILPDGSVRIVPRIGYQHSLVNVTTDGAYGIHGLDATVGIRVQLNTSGIRRDTTVSIDSNQTTSLPVAVTDPVLETRVERDTLVELRAGIQQITTELSNVVVDTLVNNGRKYRRVQETYRTYVPKPPSVLRGSIALQFVDDDGTITDKARLSATRVLSKRTVPLIPILMFDSASTEVPSRYVQLTREQASAFQGRMAVTAEEHWHYHILNIVGERMRTQKQSTCQLQMYTASMDTAVGNARMRAVRRYISSRFNIKESRIGIVPSERGLVENEAGVMSTSVIISDPTGKLLLPVEGQVSFVEARLPNVRVTPDAISEAGLRQWSVVIVQDNQDRYSISDTTGELHDVTIDLNDAMSPDAAMKSPISFILRLQDNEGTSTQTEPAIVKLTSKALRPSERATPLRRTEMLQIAGYAAMQQQAASMPGQKTVVAPAWAVKGLVGPEIQLYEPGAKAYIQEERQP